MFFQKKRFHFLNTDSYSLLCEKTMYYHFCTNGLLKNIIFSSDADYIYGMNAIAICKSKYVDVKILAFCIMNNHVHFILDCTKDEGELFMRYYKLLLGVYLKKNYVAERNLDGADIGCKEISDPDYCVRAIAYVLRNPLSAGVQVVPGEYRWSSANLYFASRTFAQRNLMSIGSIPVLKVRSLTRSHCRFSPEWRLDENGMIFPGDYVDYESVERIFLRPSQLLYYVLKNNDSSIESDTGILAKCRYSDNELCASRDILIREHFGKSRLTQLSVEERISLASMMRRRYGVSLPSLSRIIQIDRQLLRGML